ncbi:acyltransferase ChoActase/COT/CPT [Linderina pennispora]|uniref:Acyltransferase ChoActase/COT/CPT n=1 Tax=Linderina pennispora TaxID=61395 RepID=A0A1Y1WMA5_9FUNG|nr:acyltransferase ChoActase/COT/CPT [Linderina pennispora]ORX74505.1 acyltransferase ChoActase/COT/CPT [Linderina pennispora]
MSAEPRPHMLSMQSKLPRLPIPPLKQTIDQHLAAIAPIVGSDQAALVDSHKRATEFLKPTRMTQPNSWLERWWFDYAYLSWREGLCINSNYWIAFVEDPHAYGLATPASVLVPSNPEHRQGKVWDSREYGEFQIRRAVKFIQKTLDFKDLVADGRIPVDMTRAGPLCYGPIRQDKVTTNARTITVIVEDQLYSVEVYDSAGHRKLDGDLEAELFAITADVTERRSTGDLDPAVPVLTAGHRDRWSDAYAQLEKQPQNNATLLATQESLFAVSLDTTFCDPRGSINAHQRCCKCHGIQPGHNRWYDKCANYIIDRNGAVGYNGEHSPCDALIPALMLDFVAKHVAPEYISPTTKSVGTPNYQPHIRRLRFTDVPNSVTRLIEDANKELVESARNSQSRQIRFMNYGSDWIKRAAKVSPDAFTQLALQLTYYRLHNSFAAVYETASTRQYLHGRTEATRSLTSESADFMRVMTDRASSSLDKYEGIAVSRASSSGNGIDRHIMGLRLAYRLLDPLPQEKPLTENEKDTIERFFNDPALAKSTKYQLSTSGLIPAYYFTHTGFGAVVAERGYGINYMIEPRCIKFGTESKTREAGNGSDAMLELKIICEQANEILPGDGSRL